MINRWKSRSSTALLLALGLAMLGTAPAAVFAEVGDALNPIVSFNPSDLNKSAPSVNFDKELVINHTQVVNNPARTTGCGAWTFCALMTELAGTKDPSDFTLDWLQHWLSDQYINGFWVEDLPLMQSRIINRWAKKPNGDLDLNQSPFRLLAIVNRMDLRKASAGHAGEGRFVFGFYDAAGNPQNFFVIFEYKLSLSTYSSRQWATQWHALGSLNIWGNAYKNQLQLVTDKFAFTPVNGKIQLNQIRTNDTYLCGTKCFWEFREFKINQSTGWLDQTTVAQTPDGTFNSSTALRNYINANQSAILAGTHTVGSPLALGGSDLASGFWTTGVNSEARHKFSLATCTGCHIGETMKSEGVALFQHISNRTANGQSTLSNFFSTIPLRDLDGVWRVHDERGRRISFFQDLLVLLNVNLQFGGQDATKAIGIQRLDEEALDKMLPQYDRVH